ncbi:hypothetical protein ACXVUM_11745 [Williamsia sp. SKLECPSW1]
MSEGAGHAAAPGAGPSPLDMLGDAAPMLRMPVGDILKQLNLPPLPQIPPLPPLPQLPPMPTIDFSVLVKPLTDLLAGFGSGDKSAMPFDPTQLFDGLMQAMQSVVQMGTQAISALTPLWTGPAATSAATTATAANVNGTATGGQSADISTIVSTAIATVGKGVALLQGVIADFVAVATTMIPVLPTPPGQAALLAAAAGHVSAGMAIVAETRAELTAHTANMTVAGTPVAITAVPQVAAQVPGMAMSAVSAPMQGIMQATKAAAGGRGAFGARPDHLRSSGVPSERTSGAGAGGGGAGGMGAVPLGGAAGAAGTPAQPSARTVSESFGPGGSRGAGAMGKGAVDEETVVTRGGGAVPSAMPMGAGAAGAAGAGSSGTHSSDREYTVDARHTDEVVGDIPEASPTVLGEAEAPAAQSIWESPDELSGDNPS